MNIKVASFTAPTFAIISLLALTSCSTVESNLAASQPTLKRSVQLNVGNSLPELKMEIMRVIGTPYAQSITSCKVAAFGAKACGGPNSYLVYSTESSEELPLLELIARYNMLMRAENVAEGMISTCAVVLPPEVTLTNGVCVVTDAKAYN